MFSIVEHSLCSVLWNIQCVQYCGTFIVFSIVEHSLCSVLWNIHCVQYSFLLLVDWILIGETAASELSMHPQLIMYE